MLGSDFSQLAQVGEFTSLDLAPKPLTLTLDGGHLYAIYPGTYTRGEVKVPYTGDPTNFPYTVGAKQFAALSSLLSAFEEISFTANANDLVVHGGELSVTLRRVAEPPQVPEGGPHDVLCTVDAALLKAEFELAHEFSAKTTVAPLFTGIRVLSSGTNIVLMAFDGYSALFASSVPATILQPFDLTLPGYDLITGLRAAGRQIISVGWYPTTSGGKRFAFSGADCAFHATSLPGTWPDMKQLTTQLDRDDVTIHADKLRAAVSSVRVLLADNTLHLEASENGLILRTSDAEMGRFEAALGSVATLSGPVIFDVAHLELAAKLGGDITLSIAVDKNQPSLVKSGRRRYWIARRVH